MRHFAVGRDVQELVFDKNTGELVGFVVARTHIIICDIIYYEIIILELSEHMSFIAIDSKTLEKCS